MAIAIYTKVGTIFEIENRISDKYQMSMRVFSHWAIVMRHCMAVQLCIPGLYSNTPPQTVVSPRAVAKCFAFVLGSAFVRISAVIS